MRFTSVNWSQTYGICLLEDLSIQSIVLMHAMSPVIMDTQTNKILADPFSYM